jgi:hypothetical protein
MSPLFITASGCESCVALQEKIINCDAKKSNATDKLRGKIKKREIFEAQQLYLIWWKRKFFFIHWVNMCVLKIKSLRSSKKYGDFNVYKFIHIAQTFQHIPTFFSYCSKTFLCFRSSSFKPWTLQQQSKEQFSKNYKISNDNIFKSSRFQKCF